MRSRTAFRRSLRINAMTKIAVTIPQALEMSGLGRTTLYEIFKSGAIKPRKQGKRTLILVEDLEKYLNNLPVAA